jgi:DNA-binding NtrC family response regulator
MKKRILIVDDEPHIRLNYRTALETEGLKVGEANNGATALAELSTQPYDLAILDMRMPEMDGLELLAKMRAAKFQTPVVIVTAYGDIPHAVKAMRLGAIDFLQKPLTPDALRSVVWEIISRHSEPVRLSNEDKFEIHCQAAKRLINLREFKQAKEHIAKALEIRSDSPDIFNLGGVLFEMLEDYDRAKRYYGQAIRLDKHHEAAQQNMRRIYELFQFGSSKEPFNLGGTK